MTDYVLASTATDRGSGFMASWLKCRRKAAYDYLTNLRVKTPEWERNKEEGKPHKFTVGSLVHLYLRKFYEGTPIGSGDRIVWDNGQLVESTHPHSAKEAHRLWLAYKATASPDDLGEPIGFEVQARQVFADEFGDYEATAAFDRVVRVREEHVGEFQRRWGLDVKPGLYVVDDKTDSRKRADFEAYFAMSLQFKQYMLVAELHYGEPVLGLITNVLIKTKTPERIVLLVPALNDDERLMVLGMIKQAPSGAALARLTSGEDTPQDDYSANPLHCEYNGEICYHYRTGACKRW